MPGTTPLSPTAQSATSFTPSIERFATHYERYNGSIGQGANKSTHTAEVRFDSATHELAVVKAFSFLDKGWLNEAVAWTLGQAAGVAQPPKAVILVATLEELSGMTEAEMVLARNLDAGRGEPIVFWCASRLATKPPQYLSSLSWENVVLRGSAGQRLAAFDGWIGNCDRIASNAPYWAARGVVAAIDHERLAFNQDWLAAAPEHFDRMGIAETKLLERFHKAQKSNVFKPKQAREIASALHSMSVEHAGHLANCRHDIENRLLVNVSKKASNDLLTFLSERATDVYISERLGVV